MTPTPGAFARAGALALAAVILQLSGFGPGRILGGYPDLLPLVVAAVGIYAGSVPGAAMGFSVGFLVDLLAGATMGVSSLVLTAVGYGAGRYREVRDPAHGLAPMAFGLAATAGYLLALGGVTFMLGVEASVSLLVFRDVLVTVLLNGLLALPTFWILGRALRGALVSDPLARGRRQRTREAGPIGLRGLEV